jgi:hypothetical protein
VVDRCAPLEVAAGAAASIFALNLTTWRDDPSLASVTGPGETAALLARLEDRRADRSTDVIRWHMRQVVVRRTAQTRGGVPAASGSGVPAASPTPRG